MEREIDDLEEFLEKTDAHANVGKRDRRGMKQGTGGSFQRVNKHTKLKKMFAAGRIASARRIKKEKP